MTGFTFSLEQLRSAPPEVRRWAEREIAASLAQIAGSPRSAASVHAPALAACMPDEAARLFEPIIGGFPAIADIVRVGPRVAGPRHGTASCREHRRSLAPYPVRTRRASRRIFRRDQTRPFRRSATILRPRCSASTSRGTSLCTRRPAAASANCRKSSARHRRRASTRSSTGRRRQGSRRRISGRARPWCRTCLPPKAALRDREPRMWPVSPAWLPRRAALRSGSRSAGDAGRENVTKAERLRGLAAWYRQFAEKTENPYIWAARLRHAEILEAELRALSTAAEDTDRSEGSGRPLSSYP